jgi:hypothetical protein
MRKPWAAYKEGACLSPHGTSMIASMDRSQTMLLRTTTSLLRNIIINFRITIIIYHLRWAMMSPVSTRTLTTVSRPSRQDRRRYATPFTNKLNGTSRRPTDLMSYSSMSDNKQTLSTCSVGWVSSTHHRHHRSDLAWGRTPAYWGKYSFFFLVKFCEYYFSLV